MRSREITLGRKASGVNVDVDLSLEGPAWKISRRQVRKMLILINKLLCDFMYLNLSLGQCHAHTDKHAIENFQFITSFAPLPIF